MAGKLSPKAQQALDLLLEARRKTDRLHNLVEQYASTGQDLFAGQIGRTAQELGRVLMGAGYGVMADYANQLGMGAKRGGATQSKFRALREAVAQLRPAIDRAEKAVYTDEGVAGGPAS
jgi:hypothetical protein